MEIGVANRAWSDEAGPEQFTVTLGDTRYRARCGRLILSLTDDGLKMQTGTRNCEDIVAVAPAELVNPTDVGTQVLRVAARRLSTGGIELGVQLLVDGQWEALRQPTRPLLTGLSHNTWRFTSTLQLPPLSGHVFGDLRRGASITTRDGEFDLEVDERVYRTRCGVLDLDILTEHVLVDTAGEQCRGAVPLVTICPTSDCDVQQNAAYDWESRQIGTSLFQIDVTRSEAQRVVNAIFADFFPRNRAPTVSFTNEHSHGYGSRSEVVLGTNVRNLGAVVHEVTHSIVDQANVRDAGHGPAFTAMLLYLWERYFPIVDVEAARDDAKRHGMEIASRPPVRAGYSGASRTIGELFCDWRREQTTADLCDAASGAMSGVNDERLAGLYIGWGGDDEMWWGAHTADEGRFRSYLAVESHEAGVDGSIARLGIECNTEDELEVDVWWRGKPSIPSELSHRFGDGDWVAKLWRTVSGGTWGDDTWSIHRALDPRALLQEMNWHSRYGALLSVRYDFAGWRYTASFDLTGVFETPTQSNLVQCGANKESDPEAPVIDWGRLGENFRWGVDEDEEPLKTYVVKDTAISGSTREARLSVHCEDGGLEVNVYWEVDEDLDWTVLYRINDGEVQTEEWLSGWGSWGDTEYKWTGREGARDLIAQLAWAAQFGGSFTVEAHERRNPNRRYTATWPLNGLFETPIQPNLARCGQY